MEAGEVCLEEVQTGLNTEVASIRGVKHVVRCPKVVQKRFQSDPRVKIILRMLMIRQDKIRHDMTDKL